MKYIRPTTVTAISDDFDEHVARGSANPGTDYITARGEPIFAPAGGRIVDVDPFTDGSGGRMVALDTYDGDGFDFLHLLRIDVNMNQYVEQGQQIGLTGGSANGSESGVGDHLHLSFRPRHGAHYMNAGNLDFEKYVSDTSPAGLPDEGEEHMPLTDADVQKIWTHQLGNQGGKTVNGKPAVFGRAADWITNMSDAIARVEKVLASDEFTQAQRQSVLDALNPPSE